MSDDFTPLRILQITDTHLFADRHGSLHGVNMRNSLQSVLQRALQQPAPDLVLVTGDLVHDESAAGYRALFKLLKPLKAPLGVIAGNHDSLDTLRAVMPPTARLGGVHLLGGWRVVLLNSQVPGKAHGHLDNAELYFLEAALAAATGDHVLVVLHHHPVPVGSTWLDRIALDNPEALFTLLKRFSNVRAVLCGHVHQEFDMQHNGLRILATPSTCVQFRPHSAEFATDDKSPGCRWMSLNADGSIETKIERLSGKSHQSGLLPAV